MRDVFDDDLHDYLEEADNECYWCSKPITNDRMFCSEKCANDYNNER